MGRSAIKSPPTRAGVRWRAILRAAAITAAAVIGLVAALWLALADLPPEWARTDRRVTVLTIGGTDQSSSASMLTLKLDSHWVVHGGQAAFADARVASLSWILRRTNNNPILTVVPPKGIVGEPGTRNLTLYPKGKECRVVVFVRESRVDVSDCLTPVAVH